MNNVAPENEFYTSLALHDDFSTLIDANHYKPFPNDWWVGTSDICESTKAVADGQYKTVNMVAAAVISAQINIHNGASFPFIFGGDGAGFAVPPAWKARSAEALSAVRTWARDEFGIKLRVGMVRVSDIRSAGMDINVARFRVSEGANYAMFAGGGLSWADTQMRTGASTLPEAARDAKPDLTGLSCRWSHMPSRHGAMLSIIVLPRGKASDPAFVQLLKQVLEVVSGLNRSGHPTTEQGPGVTWPPLGATLEAHAQRRGGSIKSARRKALFESFVAWLLIKTGLKLPRFDARRYRRIVGDNADFRKFDDGLKMTLDCDAATEARLRSLLEKAADDGIIRLGIHSQSEAMITCIVPSILTDDHLHFVDGAGGGYTAAAQSIKMQTG